MAPWWEMRSQELLFYPCWNLDSLDLMRISAGNHQCEFMRAAALSRPEDSISQHSSPSSDSYILFASSSMDIPEPWVGAVAKDVPFRDKHSTITNFQYSAQLWVCINWCPLQGCGSNKGQWPRLRAAKRCRDKLKCLEGSFPIWPFAKTTVAGFPARVCDLPSHGLLTRFIVSAMNSLLWRSQICSKSVWLSQ